jgi:thiamine biosynthesis lipoprotein
MPMEIKAENKSGNMRRVGFLILAGLVFAAVAWFWFKGQTVPIQKRTRFLMDTVCTIYIPGPKTVLPVIDKALDRAEEIDKKFNCLNPDSPIYAFNHNNKPIRDPEIVEVAQKALAVARQSDGALDITVYPLVRLWGFFGKQGPRLPSEREIKECLKHVGYKYVAVQNGEVRKLRPDIQIDLGAVAKGYAVDEAAKILKQAKIRSALVDFGGDIYAIGEIRNRPWTVGIRNPRGEGEVGGFEISDLSTATSGDYERFFEKDGVRYHHILDPKTGYPSRGLISATVISADATLADAWSTATFVLGKEKSLALAEKTEGLQGVVLITPDGKISSSSQLARNFEKNSKGK